MIRITRQFLEDFKTRFGVYSTDSLLDDIDDRAIIPITTVDKEIWDRLHYSVRVDNDALGVAIALFNQTGGGLKDGIIISSKYYDYIEFDRLRWQITNDSEVNTSYDFEFNVIMSGFNIPIYLGSSGNINAGATGNGLFEMGRYKYVVDNASADPNGNQNPPVVEKAEMTITDQADRVATYKIFINARARRRGLEYRFDRTRTDNDERIN